MAIAAECPVCHNNQPVKKKALKWNCHLKRKSSDQPEA